MNATLPCCLSSVQSPKAFPHSLFFNDESIPFTGTVTVCTAIPATVYSGVISCSFKVRIKPVQWSVSTHNCINTHNKEWQFVVCYCWQFGTLNMQLCFGPCNWQQAVLCRRQWEISWMFLFTHGFWLDNVFIIVLWTIFPADFLMNPTTASVNMSVPLELRWNMSLSVSSKASCKGVTDWIIHLAKTAAETVICNSP